MILTQPVYICAAIKVSDALGGLPGWMMNLPEDNPGGIGTSTIVDATDELEQHVAIETTRGTLIAKGTDWICQDTAGNIYPIPDWLIQGIYIAPLPVG